MVENGQKRVTIQMCHIQNAQKAKKNPVWNQKFVKRGPKVGSKYLPTSKTSHCVHTACTAFPKTRTRSSLQSLGITAALAALRMGVLHTSQINSSAENGGVACQVNQPLCGFFFGTVLLPVLYGGPLHRKSSWRFVRWLGRSIHYLMGLCASVQSRTALPEGTVLK